MDSLILTFTREQYKTYIELLKKENIELNFDTKLPVIDEYSICNFDIEASNIVKEAQKLLKFKKQNSTFSSFLTQEEIQGFIPVYYRVIRNIEYYKKIIRADTWTLSLQINKATEICAEINQRYADFLPYKAALYNREEYALEIKKIDEQFKESIEKSENYKKELVSYFDRAINLCDLVSNFFAKISKATDDPKFKKFDTYDLFWAVEAFIQQTRNI